MDAVVSGRRTTNIGRRVSVKLARGSALVALAAGALVPPAVASEPTAPSPWLKIDASAAHSCGVRVDGTLWCWGNGAGGQVGSGNRLERLAPHQVGTATTWDDVSSDENYTCATRTDHTLWCFGENQYRQLGVGSPDDQLSPLQLPGSDWKQVDAGDGATCAVKVAGTLWCWGRSKVGQLGLGDVERARRPQQVGSDTNWLQVSTGGEIGERHGHSCGIRTDGTLWCWGRNVDGELGLGAPSGPKRVPQQLGTASDWVQVTAGDTTTCALRADASLWCWGDGAHGAVGDGSGQDQPDPVQIDLGAEVTGVSAGITGTCASTPDATWCWGENDAGQLGDGTTKRRLSPVQVDTDLDLASVSIGDRHACAVESGGRAHCWGGGFAGRLGTGTYKDHRRPVRVLHDEGPWYASWRTVSGPRLCGITSAGQVACRGSSLAAAAPAAAGTDWVEVSQASGFSGLQEFPSAHRCAIKSDRSLWCWGENTYGQLGDGTRTHQATPVQVSGDDSWASVRAAGDATCGLQTDGSAWCWGFNVNGELGLGDEDLHLVPTRLGSATWRQLGFSGHHGCGVQTDGTAWCWGKNRDGAVGDGTTTTALEPTPVDAEPGWVAVVPGGLSIYDDDLHTCGVRDDGSVWCWGNNTQGKLGDGTTTTRLTPVQVGDDTDWVTVAPGPRHTCAMRADETAWCWGRNTSGQLGDGTTTDRHSPVAVGGGHRFTSVEPTCGVTAASESSAANQLWCWGPHDEVDSTLPMEQRTVKGL